MTTSTTATKRAGLLAIAATTLLALGACETMPSMLTAPTAGAGALELRLAEAEARNDALAREVAALRGGASDGAVAMPAGVEPGRCYAFVGAEPTRSSERTLIAPERQVVRITPAIYQWVDEEIVTREARVEYEVVPAVVETVIENVLVSDGYTERTVMPARYEEVAEPAVVREPYVRFEPCAAAGERAMCAVEEPARTGAATTRRVMTEPERVRETDVPARYMRVRREVVRSPAQLVTREIPAEVETIRVQRLVQPAREEIVTVEATYAQAEADEAPDAGAVGWVEVLCDTPANRAAVRQVQQALAAAGQDPGPADGVFGAKTRAALAAYQRAQGLPEGHLTRATAERLGVEWP